MKFGQELLKKENPRFKGHYIDYKLLKKKLKSPPDRPASETDGTLQERISAAFIESLQLVSMLRSRAPSHALLVTVYLQEINRINEYVSGIKAKIDAQWSELEGTEGCCIMNGTAVVDS
jgi:SPX domain protein involved in polyphosphate accumulation